METRGVPVLVRYERKAKVWCPQLQMKMVRPLPVQCDFQRRVQFRRTFRLLLQAGKRARRGSRVEIRVSIGAVELQPPEARRKRGEAGVEAWLVHVVQTNARKGARPLEWLLLSTVGGPSRYRAQRIVRWYEARWSIEEFFEVLKSHARIEDRRLRTAEALGKCLAFDAITAWQTQSLGRYARDAPAEQVLTQDERDLILALLREKRLLPPAERDRPAQGHPHLGGVAGADGRVSAVEASAAAGAPDHLAGVRQAAGAAGSLALRPRLSCRPAGARGPPSGGSPGVRSADKRTTLAWVRWPLGGVGDWARAGPSATESSMACRRPAPA
ncbi:MAG: transposase [Bryobacterales bacterium]|nr:transposase [Bryobacterales bacterium]